MMLFVQTIIKVIIIYLCSLSISISGTACVESLQDNQLSAVVIRAPAALFFHTLSQIAQQTSDIIGADTKEKQQQGMLKVFALALTMAAHIIEEDEKNQTRTLPHVLLTLEDQELLALMLPYFFDLTPMPQTKDAAQSSLAEPENS